MERIRKGSIVKKKDAILGGFTPLYCVTEILGHVIYACRTSPQGYLSYTYKFTKNEIETVPMITVSSVKYLQKQLSSPERTVQLFFNYETSPILSKQYNLLCIKRKTKLDTIKKKIYLMDVSSIMPTEIETKTVGMKQGISVRLIRLVQQ